MPTKLVCASARLGRSRINAIARSLLLWIIFKLFYPREQSRYLLVQFEYLTVVASKRCAMIVHLLIGDLDVAIELIMQLHRVVNFAVAPLAHFTIPFGRFYDGLTARIWSFGTE